MQPEARHTPGPWHVEGEDPARWIVSDERDPDGLPVVVAEAITHMDSTGRVYEQATEANARLIAAAPDLLEAIEPYLPFLEAKAGTGWCMHDRHIEGRSASARWERLKAAVSKAKGEQP